MGVLQRFERRLEGIVGVAFARLFKGKVHPAEIAKALEREATEQKMVVGEGRVMVPNRYVVRLGPSDYEYLAEWEAELSATMAEMIQEHVEAEGWSTFGGIHVSLACEDDLRTGVFHVDSRVDADPGSRVQARPSAAAVRDAWQQPAGAGAPGGPGAGLPPVPRLAPSAGPARSAPAQGGLPPVPSSGSAGGPTLPRPAAPISHALVVDGPNTHHELHEGSNIIGRGSEASIRLPDTGVSRRHVDVQLGNGKANVVDLGSTNGTIVNGRRVPHILLSDGDVIRIGHSVLVYRKGPRSGRESP